MRRHAAGQMSHMEFSSRSVCAPARSHVCTAEWTQLWYWRLCANVDSWEVRRNRNEHADYKSCLKRSSWAQHWQADFSDFDFPLMLKCVKSVSAKVCHLYIVCVCVCSSVTFHSISIIFDYSFKWSWGAISFSSLPLKLDTLTVSLNLFSILTCLLLKLIERNLQWIAGAYVAGCGCGGFFFFFFGRSWILICMVSYKSLTWGQRVAIRQEI